MNISSVNSFIKEISTKEVENKPKVEDKKTENFKDIIESKRTEISNTPDKSKEVETDDKEIPSELKGVIKDLENKSEDLKKAIEDGNESEIIEALEGILNLLNIQIKDNNGLPLVIEMSEVQSVDGIDGASSVEPLGILDYISELKGLELFNSNSKLEAVNNTMDDQKTIELLINLLGNDKLTDLPKETLAKIKEITGISEEMVASINKLIETITPLVNTSDYEGIKKSDMLTAIKDKLKLAINEGSDKNTVTTGIENNRIVLDNKTVKESSNYEFSAITKNTTSDKELSDEDKVLNKLLGIQSDTFSQSLNRLTSRSDISVPNSEGVSTVFKDTMDEDVIKNVRFMIKNQIQELKVKIYPKELGEMTIKILSEEGIMKAEIKATSKETYNLLNSNINEIKKVLGNENIKIQEVNIGLYNDDTTYYSGQGAEGQFNEGNRGFTTNDNRTSGFGIDEEVDENLSVEDSNVDLLV